MIPDPHRKKSDYLWNILSIVALAGILVVAAVVAVIFINPQSGLNPFKPPELPPLASLATLAPESAALTSAPTVIATATQPSAVSATPGPLVLSPTTESILPPQSTTAPEGRVLYEFVVIEDPLALPASEYDPTRGCDWMGIAGQVFDLQGSPVLGIRVVLRAVLEGNTIEMIGMSGTAPVYGDSGFEIRIADHPIASSGQANVQLIDQAGMPLSEVYLFDTFDTCEENLILVDFQEIR